MKLINYEESTPRIRMLIYGLSKSGKSTLAATLASKYRLLWLNLENAADTLVKLPRDYKENIELVNIPDRSSYPVASGTILNLFKDKRARICEDHGVINCPVCLRAGKELQDVDLTKLDPKRDIVVLDSLTQLGLSIAAFGMRDKPPDYKPERDDWGVLRRGTEYMASEIQSLPFNFIATALPIEVKLEDNRTKLVPCFGSSTMSAQIAAKFSTIIYCEVANRAHRAYSSSTASSSFLSGSRSDQAIENLGVPDLVPLLDEFMLGEIKIKSVKPPQQGAQIPIPTKDEEAKVILGGLKLRLGKKT